MKKFIAPALALFVSTFSVSALVTDFSDLVLPPNSYHNTSSFSSEGFQFSNAYDPGPPYSFWNGFAYSNVTDNVTPGYLNQYSAITGSGIGASYAIAYVDGFSGTQPRLTLPNSLDRPLSISVTNTTYAYMAMLNGDGPASPFVEGDYFYLTISAYSSGGGAMGSLDFYLADFRSTNPADHYILNSWTSVDLSIFGSGVGYLEFDLTTSDTGAWGPNTPTYFALGSVSAVPEPGTVTLVVLSGLGWVVWSVRRRRLAAQG